MKAEDILTSPKTVPTLKLDRATMERFDRLAIQGLFDSIAEIFGKYPVKEVRDVCLRALEKRSPVSSVNIAIWYEKTILDLRHDDVETASALLKLYQGHYDHRDTALFRRSLTFVCSEEVRHLPARTLVRAVRSHVGYPYSGDTESIRRIYRELEVRETLVRLLEQPEKKHSAYSQEDWENAKIVFWCAVHMKDLSLAPVFEEHLAKIRSRHNPGGTIYPGGGDLFQAEADRAVIRATIDMLRSGTPAEAQDLPKDEFARWIN